MGGEMIARPLNLRESYLQKKMSFGKPNWLMIPALPQNER
jgi:hypothetical protein